MTDELKPCPFCGGKAACVEFYGEYNVLCCDCHAAVQDCSTRENAVSAWNARQIENELEAENKRLLEALTEIKNTVESIQDTVYPFHIDLDSKDGLFILETVENALK